MATMTQKKSCPLVLGTAQFGSHYGIANTEGKPDQETVTAIVREAWESGIDRFDTAQGYENSEACLGRALSELGICGRAKVISKIAPSADHLNAEAVTASVEQSLARLRVPSLYALLIHNEGALSVWDQGLKDILVGLTRSGKVDKIGISVYSPEKALQALDMAEINILQVPTNVLDRRFEKAGIFQLAEEKNKEMYIRSIFLQGLLLMDINGIPEKMRFVKPVLKKFKQFCDDRGIRHEDLAIGYLRSSIPRAYLLFGAEKAEQVRDNVKGLSAKVSKAICRDLERMFNSVDEQILNPSLWPA